MLRYQYNTYKIRDQNEADLLADPNPFALVVLTVKTALKSKSLHKDELLDLKLSLAKGLLNSHLSKSKVRRLLTFLRYYVRLENQQQMINLNKRLIS
ncbi:hypothetical protein [Spirosoma profusum]|uniref:hypothetical protein n=1 Tax=Spirosoma profusum TaxID=2771354 RepID=UPI001CC23B77|nr:hypothetical protein [Spirosoma profusum]